MVNHRRAFVTWIFVAWATVAHLFAWPMVSVSQETGTPAANQDRTLRLAGPSSGLARLDPRFAPDQPTAEILRLVFAGLVRFDADLNPVLDLAERIDVSAAGQRYTAVLRPDARFHDGRPILAADVAASLTRSLSPGAGFPASLSGPLFLADIAGARDVAAGTATTLAGVSVLDDRTVLIDLERPRTDFLPRLASVAAMVVDVTATVDAGLPAGPPNGSGPFRVLSWTADQELRLGRVAPDERGNRVTGVSYVLGPAAERPFNLYQQGLIDLATVPAGSAGWVLADPVLSTRVVRQPLFAVHHVAFRTDQAPLDDWYVRRAIQLAFPRRAVAEVMFGGLVDPANGLLPPDLLGPSPGTALPPPDLAAARDAIGRSRYGTAAAVPPIEIVTHADQVVESLRDVLQRDLGLRVTVLSLPWPDFLAGLAGASFPAHGLLWIADYPSPDALLWTLFGSDSPANATGYRNPAFDAAIEAARQAPDGATRDAHYARAHAHLVEDAVILPTYHPVDYLLVHPRLDNVTLTPLGLLAVDAIEVEPLPVVVG